MGYWGRAGGCPVMRIRFVTIVAAAALALGLLAPAAFGQTPDEPAGEESTDASAQPRSPSSGSTGSAGGAGPEASAAPEAAVGGPVVIMGIDAEDGGPGAHGPITVYEDIVNSVLANVQ